MKEIITSSPVDEVVEKILGAIETQNMRVVAHINGQANAAKMGKEVPADQIIEVFRPDFAIKVWQACKPAGHDIPLRIHIYENSENYVVVAWRMPNEVFAPYNSEELNQIGTELNEIFNNILAAIAE